MLGTKAFILATCLLGLVIRSSATSCTTAINPCQLSNKVGTTCTSSLCTCSAVGYSAVSTGCAVTDAIGAPSVTAGIYSGEVLGGEVITLTCNVATGFTATANTAYLWYTDGTVVSGETAATYAHTTSAVSGTAVLITCKVTDSDLESAASSEFTVTSYVDGDTISIPMAFSGNYATVVTGNSITLTCINLPLDPNIDFKIDSGTAGTDLTVSTFAGATHTCNYDKTNSRVLTTPTEPTVTVAASVTTAPNALDAKTLGITSHTSPLNMVVGDNIALTCGLTDASTVKYTDGTDITYTWAEDGSGIGGATSQILDTSSLTAGSKTITCIGTPTAGTAITSAGFALTVVATNPVEEVLAVVEPSPLMVGNFLVARCLVRMSQTNFDAATYVWTFSGETIVGQDDKLLQVYPLVDASHAGGAAYGCTVTSNDMSTSDAVTTLTATAVGSITPSLVSDKTTTNYATGNSYVLTCQATSSESYGLTYKWFKDGTQETAQTGATWTVTATTTSVAYTCKATFSSTDSASSPSLAIQGKAIASVSFTGVASPVVGTSPSYICSVTLPSSGGTATYIIKKDGTSVATTSTHTLSTIALSTSDGTYLCEATVGSDTLTSSSIAVVAVSAPATPVVSSSSNINIGGSYLLTCTSASAGNGITSTYEWKFTATGGTEVTLGSVASVYPLSPVASSDEGAYTCKVTINSVASTVSSSYTLSGLPTGFGLQCSAISQCTSDYTLYTGNCIDGHCECVVGEVLSQDFCGTATGTGPRSVALTFTTVILAFVAFMMSG